GPEGAEVEDDVAAAYSCVNALVAAQLPLDDLDVDALEVGAAPGGEVVEDADVVPTLEQRTHEVRSDEAAAPGDERLHSRAPATAASPMPSQVTAWSGMPAMMPTAFHVPAATKIQPAATSPKKRYRGGARKAVTSPTTNVPTPSARPTTPASARSCTQKFCTPHGWAGVGYACDGWLGNLRFAAARYGWY